MNFGRTVRAAWIVRSALPDRPLFEVRYGRFVFIFGPSTCDPRTVRPYHADRSAGHCGLSAWCLVELLSSFLLVFRFFFGIVWGLFLGLVGPL
jgi:hypothetical protein